MLSGRVPETDLRSRVEQGRCTIATVLGAMLVMTVIGCAGQSSNGRAATEPLSESSLSAAPAPEANKLRSSEDALADSTVLVALDATSQEPMDPRSIIQFLAFSDGLVIFRNELESAPRTSPIWMARVTPDQVALWGRDIQAAGLGRFDSVFGAPPSGAHSTIYLNTENKTVLHCWNLAPNSLPSAIAEDFQRSWREAIERMREATRSISANDRFEITEDAAWQLFVSEGREKLPFDPTLTSGADRR